MTSPAFLEREAIRRQIATGDLDLPQDSPFPQSPGVRFLASGEVGCTDRWFFIGDIHGDFLALHRQIDHIAKSIPDFRIVFLGDLVDRGPDSAECFLLLLKRAGEFPGQIHWIAGNHDICFSKAGDTFCSSVDPAEFLGFLNGGPECEKTIRHRIGDCFLRITGNLPRALVFPDGLLATHGGFPHTDLQEKIHPGSPPKDLQDWVNQAESLQDFTWTRITRYKKKNPNRNSRGCSYGFEDFESFCRLFPDCLPIRRMVNGHEHFDEGWKRHEEYKIHPAATLTGFGFPSQGCNHPPERYRGTWFVARHTPDDLPKPEEIPAAEWEICLFYPDQATETNTPLCPQPM